MFFASAYPNSAISAGAMMAIAFVVVCTLAIWLVMVYLAGRESGKKNVRQPASPIGVVAEPDGAAEDEHSEARPAPAGHQHEAAA
jgi:hypothetical protein